MPGRVRDVKPTGQHGNSDPLDRQRGPVRRAVDAVRAPRNHRHPALGQAGCQVAGHLLAIRRGRPSPDYGGCALCGLIEG